MPPAVFPLRPPAVAGSAKIPIHVASTIATISFFMPLIPLLASQTRWSELTPYLGSGIGLGHRRLELRRRGSHVEVSRRRPKPPSAPATIPSTPSVAPSGREGSSGHARPD